MNKEHFKRMAVKNESDYGKSEPRVVKLDQATVPTVQDFQFSKLQIQGSGSYAATKAKYGAIAATDSERSHRGQKDRRFSLNPLLKEPLSIEEEERRVIEEKVRERIAVVEEEARAKAHQEGYQAGLKQGHQEAYQRFQKDSSERILQFEKLIQELETAKSEIFRANERFLMELVFRISRTLLLKDLSVDREYVLRLARELLERVGVRENIRIRIHPNDAETAQMIKPSLEKALGTLSNLSVETSSQVSRGGCLVETEWNSIDASIDTQLQGVYESLLPKKSEEPGSA